MGIVMLALFIIFPIFGIVLTTIAYINSKSKFNNLIYSIIIGLFIGIIAYNFIPAYTYDLTRHHLIVKQLFNQDIHYLFVNFKKLDLEILPLLSCFFVAKFHNVNLLQFIVTTLGYSIIFYMLGDVKIRYKLKCVPFILLCLFTFFSFNTLNFISGLWNYLAIIIFSLAIYKDYIVKSNKISIYMLYILTLFIHNSMFFPIVILLIYKLFGNKLTIKSIVITIVIFTVPSLILNIVNNIFNIGLFKLIESTYNSYFTNDAAMYRLYGGRVLIMEIIKIVTILCSLVYCNKKDRTIGLNGFIILLALATISMLPKSIVMIRFVMILGFIGIVPLANSIKTINKNNIFYIILIIVITLAYMYMFYCSFKGQSFNNLFNQKIYGWFFNYFS